MSTDPTTQGILTQFEISTFIHDGISHDVYRAGTGPAILVMHEIPGITPQIAAFAQRLLDAGYTVFMPNLFGQPGKPLTGQYGIDQMVRACVSREFNLLASHKSSPVTQWLRALSRYMHEEVGGRGIGAIGMCITGNFALALMVDPWVMAPVLSQPSLPLPITASHKRALHLSGDDLAVIKARARDDGQCVLGMRFTEDFLTPPERFERLRDELGDRFEGIEIDSGPDNPNGVERRAHSVVTTDLIDVDGSPTRAALDRLLAFFGENLASGTR